jgi:hypothetical protein
MAGVIRGSRIFKTFLSGPCQISNIGAFSCTPGELDLLNAAKSPHNYNEIHDQIYSIKLGYGMEPVFNLEYLEELFKEKHK